MIYLDNAATTKIAPEVLAAMMPYLTEQYGNAGSIYSHGMRSAKAIKEARAQVAHFLSSSSENIIFTSGGSEGNNMVIKGVAEHLEKIGKKHIIISAIEHSSVLNAAKTLTKSGFDISYVFPDSEGVIRADQIMPLVREDTGFVSVMEVNNETGGMNDIRGIGFFCRKSSILYHSDCVQTAGEFEVSSEYSDADFITIASHKIHGPKGMGAIYAREPKLLTPLIDGGANQEFGLRGGTENVAGIVGFGIACERMTYARPWQKIHTFWELFEETLLSKVDGVRCNSNSCGKIVSITVDGVLGETLVLLMDTKGVCISAGSACTSNYDAPSHALLAYGLTEEEARSTVRVSFSKYNTLEEAETAANIMAECISSLREISKK